MARTGVLEAGAQMFFRYGRGHTALATGLAFVAVLVVSGLMNNTPVVVIFIPIMQALSSRLGQSPSRLMMPLSFASILGGMVTLIGSSTNLLVSGMLIELGEEGFSFFQFAIPGMALAGVGIFYVIFACPRLLPERASLGNEIAGGGRQFMAEITVFAGSKFHGMQPRGGFSLNSMICPSASSFRSMNPFFRRLMILSRSKKATLLLLPPPVRH